MITVKKLRELLKDLPGETLVVAYEGEGIGLTLRYLNWLGWIETGHSLTTECDHDMHDVEELRLAGETLAQHFESGDKLTIKGSIGFDGEYTVKTPPE